MGCWQHSAGEGCGEGVAGLSAMREMSRCEMIDLPDDQSTDQPKSDSCLCLKKTDLCYTE